MAKKILRIACVLSGVMLCSLSVLLWGSLAELRGKMGLGGDEDTLTVVFWTAYFLFRSPVFWGALASLAVLITTGVLLLRKK